MKMLSLGPRLHAFSPCFSTLKTVWLPTTYFQRFLDERCIRRVKFPWDRYYCRWSQAPNLTASENNFSVLNIENWYLLGKLWPCFYVFTELSRTYWLWKPLLLNLWQGMALPVKPRSLVKMNMHSVMTALPLNSVSWHTATSVNVCKTFFVFT